MFVWGGMGGAGARFSEGQSMTLGNRKNLPVFALSATMLASLHACAQSFCLLESYWQAQCCTESTLVSYRQPKAEQNEGEMGTTFPLTIAQEGECALVLWIVPLAYQPHCWAPYNHQTTELPSVHSP